MSKVYRKRFSKNSERAIKAFVVVGWLVAIVAFVYPFVADSEFAGRFLHNLSGVLKIFGPLVGYLVLVMLTGWWLTPDDPDEKAGRDE
jgi:hypothetical protein